VLGHVESLLGTIHGVLERAGAVHEPEQAAHRPVEHRLLDLTVFHRSHQGRAEEASPSGHLQGEAGTGGGCGGPGAEPVT